jgi:hypothetical protein
VAKRHPYGDASTTQYYYLIRALDSLYKDPEVSVRGPFSKEEYESLEKELKLPEFSKEL